MKQIKTILSVLTIAAALTMTTISCSSDDTLTATPEQTQVTTNGVQVTVGVSLADDATTRSEVEESTDANSKKHTLKFTTGDKLHVYGEKADGTRVLGTLNMKDGSLSADGKSAQFTGSVSTFASNGDEIHDYDFEGKDPLLCTAVPTTATLVQDGNGTIGAVVINISSAPTINYEYMVAANVNTLMEKGLYVHGDYNSSNKSFALSCTDPIFNCTISGLTASKYYRVYLKKDGSGSDGVLFQSDANGVATFAFATSHSGSGAYTIEIKDNSTSTTVGTIDLGTRNLTAKVYNVSRCWAGNRFIKLNGKFTINAGGDQVYFAPGNLQATTTDLGNTWSWHFAANQWDCIGGRSNSGYETETGNNFINGNGTVSANGTVDLFGWVGASSSFTGAALYGISNSKTNGDYGNVGGEALKSDWGNTIGTGWRTLTSDEWKWLLGPYNPQPGTSCRTSSTIGGTVNARWLKATVNSVKGLIIFPDVFAWNTTSMGSAPTTCNTGGDNFTHSLTSVEWTAAEAAGAVFLPAARRRNGSSVTSGDPTGEYWTSSPNNESNANSVFFHSNSLNPADYCNRYYGCSVRLVRDAN